MGETNKIKPYYQTEHGTIYNGHVLNVLKELPAESVQCCVTSPPYWGLRDYQLEPQVWDDPRDCEHVWKIVKGTKNIGRDDEYCGGKQYSMSANGPKKPVDTQFCQLCNAWKGSLGLEPTPELYVKHITDIFREVRRVLRKDGTLWLNMGDSYAREGGKTAGLPRYWDNRLSDPGGLHNLKPLASECGLKPKDLIGVPWMVAFALQADGWYLRSAIPWVKRSAMPESTTDRPASALEYMFLLSKSQKYYFDMDAIRIEHQDLKRPNGFKGKDGIGDRSPNQGWHGGKVSLDKHREYNPEGRNFRNTDLFFQSIEPPHGMIFCGDELVGIDVNPHGFKKAHFATFPPKPPKPCIVLDPFIGAGTTFVVSYKHNRICWGIELSESYLKAICIPRIEKETKQLRLFN